MSRSANLPPVRGADLLHNPTYNKGTAFTEAERDILGLHGLLPPRVMTIDQQAHRAYASYCQKTTDLEKYIYLIALQDRNETLFYSVVLEHLEEMMPILYTPTVGKASQEYGNIFRRPRGLYISILDRGRVREILRNWPEANVQVIVVTDGERILGLGDLGANGMGIPVGKLALYSALAGIHPSCTLPITLDVGTNNAELVSDPHYNGLPLPRVRGEAYDALIEELVEALNEVFPGVLLQFEDFANINAFRLLAAYREKICTFNDDIQGTAAVTLAGLYSALRIRGGSLAEQTILFLGAGAAGVGVGDLIATAMMDEGIPEADALRRIWFVDTQGLVVKSREGLRDHKLRFAHDHAPSPDLLSAIHALRPTILIGLSGQPGVFTKDVIDAMASINKRPVVFSLSNPTSKSELRAEDAYGWTGGRVIYASGSPFPPVTVAGTRFVPGQSNNAYVFPGVGLGITVSGASRVTDTMFFAAARCLAGQVSEGDLAQGSLFPPLAHIREVSAQIAIEVARLVWDEGWTQKPRPEDISQVVRDAMYQPEYPMYA